MGKQLYWSIFGLCLQLSISRATDDPEVTLSTGRVRGQKVLSVLNRPFYSFRGIPYAAPPVGYLRFKAPQPPESWDGVLEANKNPPACSQPSRTLNYTETYSEDCLYINVYTPLQAQGGFPMPIMIWIHGGMQFTGSSTSYKYGADFLCSENVILVTFNYRLGMFGYLNTNSKSAQGNAAAKDKIFALKWVQREISQFGGDPGSVTIFGDSSGGQDVNCLYISPMARGLFHKAISHSAPPCGTSYNPFPYNPAMKLAEGLGCPTSDPELAVACLRTVPAQVLANKQVEVINPGFSNMMVVEKYCGEEMFMPDNPEELLKNSQSSLPYMMGINSGEGILNVRNARDIPSQLSYFEKNFQQFLPYPIRQKATPKTMGIIVDMLKRFYFGDMPITSNIIGFIKFMTDRQFAYYVTEEAKSISSHAFSFLYYFSFLGEFQTHPPWTTQYNVSGVSHGDEQGYLFFRNIVIPEQNHLAAYPQEYETLRRMVRLWTNFAKYGNPTPDKNDELLNTTWLPVSTTVTRHMVIDKTLFMNSTDLLAERMDVWKTIFSWAEADSGSQSSGESTTAGINILSYILGLTLIALLYLVYDSSFHNGYRPLE